jgi:hypothetical protein
MLVELALVILVQLPATGVHATQACPESLAEGETLVSVALAVSLDTLPVLLHTQVAPIVEELDAASPASRKRADDPSALSFTDGACAYAVVATDISVAAHTRGITLSKCFISLLLDSVRIAWMAGFVHSLWSDRRLCRLLSTRLLRRRRTELFCVNP